MPIEYRNASFRERPYGGGRLIRRVEAEWGKIRAFGANKTEAKNALLEAIEQQLANAYTRRYLRTDDVTFALYYADGWNYDIVTGDGHRTSSTMLGAEILPHDAFASMNRHFEQYVAGKEFERGVDRTNGELDRAVVAYREDPSDENRERVLAAQEAHVEAFHRERTGEAQLRTHD